jgi:hypothetical protein
MKKEVVRFTVPVVIKYDSEMDRERGIHVARKNLPFYEEEPGDYFVYSLTPTLQKKKKKKK